MIAGVVISLFLLTGCTSTNEHIGKPAPHNYEDLYYNNGHYNDGNYYPG